MDCKRINKRVIRKVTKGEEDREFRSIKSRNVIESVYKEIINRIRVIFKYI